MKVKNVNPKYKDIYHKSCMDMLKPGDLLIGRFGFSVGNALIEMTSVVISESNKYLLADQNIIDAVDEIFVKMSDGFVKIWGRLPW